MEDDDFKIDVLRVDSVGDTASSRLFFEYRRVDRLSITMATYAPARGFETLMMSADVDAARKMRDWLNEFLAIADGGGGLGKEEGEVGGGSDKQGRE